MPKIITLTFNPAVDRSCAVEQVVSERKLRCGEPSYHPGGGGVNVARAITELGGDVAAYWTRGGVIGQLLHEQLDREGVRHHPLAIEAMTRENLIVFEESSGQQFRFGMPGATLREQEIEACLDSLRKLDPVPQYVVLSGSLPPRADEGLYARVAKVLPSSCKVVLDTSGRPLRLGLEASVFLVKPNLHELGEIGGCTIEDDTQLRSIARSLIEDGKARVVVTSLGSGGVVLTTADVHQQIRAPTVKIRSKVGAGDSMVAGLVHALEEGKSVTDAARYGVAAGSAAVMTDGTELCRREDAERLYHEMTGE